MKIQKMLVLGLVGIGVSTIPNSPVWADDAAQLATTRGQVAGQVLKLQQALEAAGQPDSARTASDQQKQLDELRAEVEVLRAQIEVLQAQRKLDALRSQDQRRFVLPPNQGQFKLIFPPNWKTYNFAVPSKTKLDDMVRSSPERKQDDMVRSSPERKQDDIVRPAPNQGRPNFIVPPNRILREGDIFKFRPAPGREQSSVDIFGGASRAEIADLRAQIAALSAVQELSPAQRLQLQRLQLQLQLARKLRAQ